MTPSADPPVVTTPVASARGTQILLVEPDPLAAKLIELTLARQPDVRLRTCASAEDLLRMLFAKPPEIVPDVLVCTLVLPGVHGLSLIRTLRADPAWNSLPIIALAAHDEPHTEAMCTAAGATRYLTKAQFCSNLARWTSTIVGLAPRNKLAA